MVRSYYSSYSSISAFLSKFLYKESGYNNNNVDEVVLIIIGAITWRSALDIELSQNSGIDQRVCWLSFYIVKQRYVLCYSVITQQFDLYKDSIKGTILYSFDNSWTAKRVKDVFRIL